MQITSNSALQCTLEQASFPVPPAEKIRRDKYKIQIQMQEIANTMQGIANTNAKKC